MNIRCPHCNAIIKKKASSRKGVAMIMIQANYLLKCPKCENNFNHYSAFGTEFAIPKENVLEEKLT